MCAKPGDDRLATLAQLEERRAELLARLEAGDTDAEAALARVDRAIAARTLKVRHSKARVAAAKDAVRAGVPAEVARKPKSEAERRRLAKAARARGSNRFE